MMQIDRNCTLCASPRTSAAPAITQRTKPKVANCAKSRAARAKICQRPSRCMGRSAKIAPAFAVHHFSRTHRFTFLRLASYGITQCASCVRLRGWCRRSRPRHKPARPARGIRACSPRSRPASRRHRARLARSRMVEPQAPPVDHASHRHALGHRLDRAAGARVARHPSSASAGRAAVRLRMRRLDAPARRLAEPARRAVDLAAPLAQPVEERALRPDRRGRRLGRHWLAQSLLAHRCSSTGSAGSIAFDCNSTRHAIGVPTSMQLSVR